MKTLLLIAMVLFIGIVYAAEDCPTELKATDKYGDLNKILGCFSDRIKDLKEKIHSLERREAELDRLIENKLEKLDDIDKLKKQIDEIQSMKTPYNIQKSEKHQSSATSFISGTYDDGANGICTLNIGTTVERESCSLYCKNKEGNAIFTASWFSGPINGHPYEKELNHAGVDKEDAGGKNLAWGRCSNEQSGGGGVAAYGCFRENVISAQQSGNILYIIKITKTNRCSRSFTYTTPQ